MLQDAIMGWWYLTSFGDFIIWFSNNIQLVANFFKGDCFPRTKPLWLSFSVDIFDSGLAKMIFLSIVLVIMKALPRFYPIKQIILAVIAGIIWIFGQYAWVKQIYQNKEKLESHGSITMDECFMILLAVCA